MFVCEGLEDGSVKTCTSNCRSPTIDFIEVIATAFFFSPLAGKVHRSEFRRELPPASHITIENPPPFASIFREVRSKQIAQSLMGYDAAVNSTFGTWRFRSRRGFVLKIASTPTGHDLSGEVLLESA